MVVLSSLQLARDVENIHKMLARTKCAIDRYKTSSRATTRWGEGMQRDVECNATVGGGQAYIRDRPGGLVHVVQRDVNVMLM